MTGCGSVLWAGDKVDIGHTLDLMAWEGISSLSGPGMCGGEGVGAPSAARFGALEHSQHCCSLFPEMVQGVLGAGRIPWWRSTAHCHGE